MKRKSLKKEVCPIARSLDEVGDWWSLLIVRDVFLGHRRFGEIQTGLGIAKNILTTRLKKLVAHEVLSKIPASDGSAYEEYALTDKGRKLLLVLMALRGWGEECRGPGGKADVIERATGQPVRIEIVSHDGRVLSLDEVEFVAK